MFKVNIQILCGSGYKKEGFFLSPLIGVKKTVCRRENACLGVENVLLLSVEIRTI